MMSASTVASRPAPQSVSRMTPASEEDLLEAIASRRDHAAFQELFDRYHRQAYRLALYFSGNSSQAEDIVQDAMLDIWLHAEQYQRQRGPAGAWLLRLVANRGLRAVRRKQIEKKRTMVQTNETPRPDEASPAQAAQQQELLGAMRGMLDQLPLDVRRILALYYAGGLSQDEISKELELPPSTVSLRIQDALGELRLRFQQAGFTAALPLLSAEGLREAICSGDEVPLGLRERVLEGITTAVRHSLRTSAAVGVSAGTMVALGTLALLGIGAAVWIARSEAPAPALPAKPPTEELLPAAPLAPPAAVPAPPPAAPEAFSRLWTFDAAGGRAGLKVLKGDWHPVKGQGPLGSDCMETGKDDFFLRLEEDIPKLPALLTLEISPLEFQFESNQDLEFLVIVKWDRRWIETEFLRLNPNPQYKAAGQWGRVEALVTASYVALYVDGKLMCLDLCRRTPESRLHVLCRGRWRLDRLEVRAPAERQASEVAPLLEALERLPLAERKGILPLPGLAARIPGKPVLVKFYGAPKP